MVAFTTATAALAVAKPLAEVASPIIKGAFNSIEKTLESADQLASTDAQYYSAYFQAADQAVKGLEHEYIDILLEAARCEPTDSQQRERLLTRIDHYIHREVLRPILKASIEHLREGRQALQKHAERLLIRPAVKTNRTAALAQFDHLLNELDTYLGQLGGWKGPSAIALADIEQIKKDIEDRISGAKFKKKIDNLLMNRDKSILLSTTGNCARVIEALRTAFR